MLEEVFYPAFMLFVILLIVCRAAWCGLVITEVEPNPPGNSSGDIPGDLTHEFVEVYNTGPLPVNLSECYFIFGSSGSSTVNRCDPVVWAGDSLRNVGRDSAVQYAAQIPAGAFAIMLCRGYVSAPESTWYAIASGTFIFTSKNKYFRSGGLANSGTTIQLFDSSGLLLSSFNSFLSSAMDPGESWTQHLIAPDSQDFPGNWAIAFPTPGGQFPYQGAREYGSTLVINEVMSDPLEGHPEWIELFNPGDDTVDLRGWRIGGNEEDDFLLTPDMVFVPPGHFAIITEDNETASRFFPDALCPLIEPEAWDALRRDDDIIVIRDRNNVTIDSLAYAGDWFPVSKGVSFERVLPGGATNQKDNWHQSRNVSGSTAGFANSSPEEAVSAFHFTLQNSRIRPGCGCDLSRITMHVVKPADDQLTIKIYDIRGRVVRSICDRATGTAPYLFWDGKHGNGHLMPAGLYLISVRNEGSSAVLEKYPVALLK
ncbi:MAG: hypothetical protein A2268_00045 [Candidatus Raymondbacteria bacterium RifOxyA12_full_50_37]|uniref:LTD domain-containing protein n=1 Tax=Candidatus Raymondbacteria bacterium RIFOXYD12_FULL_49_13 TaxID=1817890 RepID=A0A1F7F3H1_UNCRA|nr:MAG: hypothetical protein A2248_00355 [Candidatus Raymondbacteria bacterium RIFOXYA2_FULL_49_16]OGJ91097.1 MAG: hypothetical protein A2350_07315 [Candidatus Raymondbacteria bacterium RifOxyB12_full_50_8]OGJ91366.1 MAG: hypothetical protein A2268_00045 [Candidatus Raymondbacteria bacterium RifOxyA12_full_50_37]OGJ97151.1 MAG: hypothetical protein A2453_12565 [Candidatus Raymondbacteria bacterium RIFOXYC2_FULL_50_21]OGK01148.1 MAG: hypothetical protein A2519_01325 [Candidatus Raymondbacteria b